MCHPMCRWVALALLVRWQVAPIYRAGSYPTATSSRAMDHLAARPEAPWSCVRSDHSQQIRGRYWRLGRRGSGWAKVGDCGSHLLSAAFIPRDDAPIRKKKEFHHGNIGRLGLGIRQLGNGGYLVELLGMRRICAYSPRSAQRACGNPRIAVPKSYTL
jgi:hypothetical protein